MESERRGDPAGTARCQNIPEAKTRWIIILFNVEEVSRLGRYRSRLREDVAANRKTLGVRNSGDNNTNVYFYIFLCANVCAIVLQNV